MKYDTVCEYVERMSNGLPRLRSAEGYYEKRLRETEEANANSDSSSFSNKDGGAAECGKTIDDALAILNEDIKRIKRNMKALKDVAEDEYRNKGDVYALLWDIDIGGMRRVMELARYISLERAEIARDESATRRREEKESYEKSLRNSS